MPAELLTPTAAAELIGVHPRTLKRWAAQGKVRHVLLPSGRFMFPPDLADDVLDVREPETAA